MNEKELNNIPEGLVMAGIKNKAYASKRLKVKKMNQNRENSVKSCLESTYQEMTKPKSPQKSHWSKSVNEDLKDAVISEEQTAKNKTGTALGRTKKIVLMNFNNISTLPNIDGTSLKMAQAINNTARIDNTYGNSTISLNNDESSTSKPK